MNWESRYIRVNWGASNNFADTQRFSDLSCFFEERHPDILSSPVQMKGYSLCGDLRHRSTPDLHSRCYEITPAIGIFDQALKFSFTHLHHADQLKL